MGQTPAIPMSGETSNSLSARPHEALGGASVSHVTGFLGLSGWWDGKE